MGPGSVWYDDVTVELLKAPPAEPGEPVPTDGAPLTAVVTPDAALPHHVYLAQELQRLLLPGDPFVLRTASPRATVGGGRILDADKAERSVM